MTIRAMMTIMLGLLIALLAGVGGWGVYNSMSSVHTVQEYSLADARSRMASGAVRYHMAMNRVQILLALQHDPNSEFARLHDHPVTMHLDAISTATQRLETEWEEYKRFIHSDEEKRIADEWYAKSNGFAIRDVQQTAELIRAGKFMDAGQTLLTKINPSYNEAYKIAEQLGDLLDQQSKANNAYVESRLQTSMMITIAVVALGILVAIFSGILTIRRLYHLLGGEPAQAAGVVKNIAAGDLTHSVPTRATDQTSLLREIQSMQFALINMAQQIRMGTETISTAASQIAAGNLDLSSRTEEQAGSLEETASSMQEITAAVRQSGENARHANQLATESAEIASKGGEIVSRVVETMDEIESSSNKVANIINVIDGIAFQTNILALNAAVEAARAGELGSGFAVVATEVRSLAQRSAQAAREIKALIDDSVSKASAGSRLVQEAGETMDQIVTSIQRVSEIMGEIYAAVGEQISGIEQVNQAITEIDRTTQQNAALVEEAAAAAASLQNQATEQERLINFFRLKDDGRTQRLALPL